MVTYAQREAIQMRSPVWRNANTDEFRDWNMLANVNILFFLVVIMTHKNAAFFAEQICVELR